MLQGILLKVANSLMAGGEKGGSAGECSMQSVLN